MNDSTQVESRVGLCRPPPLPENYVARPAEYERVKGLLVGGAAPSAVAITTALEGSGGYGKTTLANKLCRDLAPAFEGGAYWVTLGKTPRVEQELAALAFALTGRRMTFEDAADGVAQINAALGDRACLLVIDDVWTQDHLRPFIDVGRRCVHLFTTRRADVAEAGHPVKVDAMRSLEAVRLLASRLSSRPADLGPFEPLARRMGRWPLLLNLASGKLRARMRHGDSLDQALAYLDRALEKRGVLAFDLDDEASRDRAVQASMALSLEELSRRHRHAYLELAIFPEDTDIPIRWAAAAWGVDDVGAEDLVTALADLRLVECQLGEDKTFRLHDVIRDYIGRQLPDKAAVHERLLKAWPSPYSLPDAYGWHWYPYHVLGARGIKAARGLAVDFRWLQSKLNVTDTNLLLADFGLFGDDRDVRLVQSAIRLSAHALGADRSQLPSQLIGRLSRESADAIRALVREARDFATVPWLCPRTPTLIEAGSPLLQTLAGHSGEITAVAASGSESSASGMRAVSGSEDGTVGVWELSAGADVARLVGHAGPVRAVAVTADGTRAVSGGHDRTVRVWDLKARREVRRLEGHDSRVMAVAVTPDGQRAVSASEDATLRMWDLVAGRETCTLAGHAAPVNAVAVTRDGATAVSGSDDGTVRVWDLVRGRQVRELTGHVGQVNAVGVSPDGGRAVSGGVDRTVRVWDLRTGREVHRFAGHDDSVRTVLLTPDGTRVVSGADDRSIRAWDLGTGREVHSLRGHGGRVNAVAITDDGAQVVSGADDRTVRVWALLAPPASQAAEGHAGQVNAVAVTADGKLAVSSSDDMTVRVWELSSGRELHKLVGHEGSVGCVAVDAAGTKAVSTSQDGTVRVWDLQAGRLVHTLDGHRDWILAAGLCSGCSRAVSGSDDSTVRVWDLARGRQVHVLAGHQGWVNALAVTPDGASAVSGGYDGTVRVWDLDRGRQVHALVGHSHSVTTLAIAAHGNTAASGGYDRTVRLWDLGSGREIHRFEGHGGWVTAVAFTPDETKVVSGSQDGTVRVWDLAEGREVHSLLAHAVGVNALVVTAGGSRAVSSGYDRTVRVWDLRTGHMLAAFTCDNSVFCCAADHDCQAIVAGDSAGRVHILRLITEPDRPRDTEKVVMPATIFVSYSRADAKHREAITKFLAPLLRDGTVHVWDDTRIPPGADWRNEIETAMSRASVAVLLVTADFLASAYCTDVELPSFIEAQRNRGLRIVGVLVDDCLWGKLPYLAERQMLPRDERGKLKPVEAFQRRSRAWTQVADAVAQLVAGPEAAVSPPATPAPGRRRLAPAEHRNAMPNTVEILFLAANPKGTKRLALDQEFREIRDKVRRSKYRDRLALSSDWAVRPDDLIQLLNERSPHVIHFSGHGSSADEIVLVDDKGRAKPLGKAAVENLFRLLSGNVRVVVLNACFSETQAKAIVRHVDCAVGMSRAIGDRAAIIFAASFYRALGFGHSVKHAFEQGKLALQAEGIPEDTTPQLLVRRGVDPEKLILVTGTSE